MSNSKQGTNEDYVLWWLITSMRRAMRKARAKELLEIGLSPSEAVVLFVVNTVGYRCTPAEISRWVLREPHSTSGILDRMEKGGLIRKVKDLERRNMIRVEMTEKGRKLHEIATKRRKSIRRIMSVLSDKERHELKNSLQKIRDKALKEIGITRKAPFPPTVH